MDSFFPKFFGLFWLGFSVMASVSILALIAAEFHKQRKLQRIQEITRRIREIQKQEDESSEPFDNRKERREGGEEDLDVEAVSKEDTLRAIEEMMEQK